MAQFQIKNFTVARVLSVFSNESDYLVTEHPLSSFDLPQFMHHFGVRNVDGDVEIICEYDVRSKDVEFLSKYLAKNIEFDFETYSYFLSCYRVDE